MRKIHFGLKVFRKKKYFTLTLPPLAKIQIKIHGQMIFYTRVILKVSTI